MVMAPRVDYVGPSGRVALALLLAGLMLLSFLAPPAYAQLTVAQPAQNQIFTPGEQLVVAGTAPTGAAVTMQLRNPAGTIVAFGQTIATDGTFEVLLTTWPSAEMPPNFPFGTYTLIVFSAGDTVEINISFQAEVPAPPVEELPPSVEVQIRAPAVAAPGETIVIWILVSEDGKYAAEVDFAPEGLGGPGFPHIHASDGSVATRLSPVRVHNGLWRAEAQLPIDAMEGSWVIVVPLAVGGTSRIATQSFLVLDSKISTEASVSGQLEGVKSAIDSAASELADDIAGVEDRLGRRIDDARSALASAISDAQSSIEGAIGRAQSSLAGSISSAQEAITGSVEASANSLRDALTGAISSARDSINGQVGAVRSDVEALRENLESINAGVGQASTFILVVGALAAITLVLELAILVRKLSA